MSPKTLVKKSVSTVLANPLVGRPLRKFFWLSMRVLERLHGKAHKTFWRLPYVVQLNNDIGFRNTFEANTKYFRNLRHLVERLPYQPKISVLVPVYKVKPQYLWDALQSVAFQTYPHWELCIVDDASGMPELHQVIEEFRTRYPDKVRVAVNEKNSHISATSNRCLELATGEYTALLDHDDRLYPNALGEMVRYINLHKQPDVLYSDERVVDANGHPLNLPFFKPDWSPFLHLSVNYTTHLTVYNTALMRQVGGFRVGLEGSQDHDLMLRMTETTAKPVVHVPICLYQWRAHPASTASGAASKPYAAVAGEKAVSEALKRRGRPGTVSWEPETLHLRVRYDLPKPAPMISIVIPTKDGYDHISRCLDSVFGKSTYPNFEVIVIDNGTTDQRCLDLLARYERDKASTFRRIVDNRPFNFAAMNNDGARAARGDFIVLLNNDTEVITPEWLEEMLSVAQWPEVGAVGCKLLFPDHKIQHAGVSLFGTAIAGHIGAMAKEDDLFYVAITKTIHEVAGVTGACLMIEKKKYFELDGLDEYWVPNGWGDVELNIKLMRRGYKNIYTPYATLYHFESQTRKVALEYFEQFYMRREYGQELLNDPYLHPGCVGDGRFTPNPWYLGFELPESSFRWLLTNYQSIY